MLISIQQVSVTSGKVVFKEIRPSSARTFELVPERYSPTTKELTVTVGKIQRVANALMLSVT